MKSTASLANSLSLEQQDFLQEIKNILQFGEKLNEAEELLKKMSSRFQNDGDGLIDVMTALDYGEFSRFRNILLFSENKDFVEIVKELDQGVLSRTLKPIGELYEELDKSENADQESAISAKIKIQTFAIFEQFVADYNVAVEYSPEDKKFLLLEVLKKKCNYFFALCHGRESSEDQDIDHIKNFLTDPEMVDHPVTQEIFSKTGGGVKLILRQFGYGRQLRELLGREAVKDLEEYKSRKEQEINILLGSPNFQVDAMEVLKTCLQEEKGDQYARGLRAVGLRAVYESICKSADLKAKFLNDKVLKAAFNDLAIENFRGTYTGKLDTTYVSNSNKINYIQSAIADIIKEIPRNTSDESRQKVAGFFFAMAALPQEQQKVAFEEFNSEKHRDFARWACGVCIDLGLNDLARKLFKHAVLELVKAEKKVKSSIQEGKPSTLVAGASARRNRQTRIREV